LVDASRLIVRVNRPEEIARVAAALIDARLSLYRLAPERLTLEELFLDLTAAHGLAELEVTA
jgi:hypothetical protein